jgi:putative ABC transport system substrate-binding protein
VRRREFITLLGSATVACSYAARAQQSAMPTVAYLSPTSLESLANRLRAFRQGLREAGYIEGENIALGYRFAEGRNDRLPAMASELVRAQVSVLVTGGTAAALAAKAATTTIPVVFIVAENPVQLGLVASIARPGGNGTGINFLSGELVAKRLEILRELIPGAVRVAVLINPLGGETSATDVENSARAMGLQIHIFKASTSDEIYAVFATIVRERFDAVFLGSDPFFTSRRVQLATLAARYAIPMACQAREVVEVGGLVSYGANIADAFRQAGIYAGRILKGSKPAALPVMQSSNFELVINAATAKILGLTVPGQLLARADEVIE